MHPVHNCRASFILTLLCIVSIQISAYAALDPIPVQVDVPEGLETYTGWAPINFGVPFSEGILAMGDAVSLCDQNMNPIPAEITITATWGKPDAPEPVYVKWLLVESLVEFQNGALVEILVDFQNQTSPKLSLCLGQGTAPTHHPLVSGVDMLSLNPMDVENEEALKDLGSFALEDRRRDVYEAKDGVSEAVLERDTDLFKVYRIEGSYTHQASDMTLGDYVTRIRIYENQPFIKLTHTMIWTGDGSEQLRRLSYILPELADMATMQAGLNGNPIPSEDPSGDPRTSIYLQQLSTEQVNKYGEFAYGKNKIDGWLQTSSSTNGSVFAAVRWPWQQYPMRIHASQTEQRIDLFAPAMPSGLTAYEIAELDEFEKGQLNQFEIDYLDQLKNYETDDKNAIKKNFIAGVPLSPRGLSKTYEILLWKDPSPAGAPSQRNQFLQTPIVAHADPGFMTEANLPSPVSEKDSTQNPLIEGAIESFFHWVTARRVEQGDFGAWSFGEIQYDWESKNFGPPLYRYWMNNGRGWSVVPWLLWLRSGERDYLHEAEQNSRHRMDIDVSHVPEWPDEDTPDLKRRGGMYSYAPVQGAWFPGKVADRYGDSEYLGIYFYLTGYERAWDVLDMREEALRRFSHDFRFNLSKSLFKTGDWSRNSYRTLGELAIAYEATHDPELKNLADEYIDLIIRMQRDDGLIPGKKSNFWFSQSMNIAARAFPERRQEILDVLQKWNNYRGDVIQSGSTGNVLGPMSLWTLRSLIEEGASPGAHYPQLAWQIMRAQTMGVHTLANDYEGFSGLAGHESAWFLRDWLVALQMSEENPVAEDAWHPVSHIHGLLPVASNDDRDGWKHRHVAFIWDEQDQAITVKSHFWLFNLGTGAANFRYRLYAPDLELVDYMTAPIPTLADSNQAATIDIQIPADGKTGAYALEILGTRQVPVNLRQVAVNLNTDEAKVVHAYGVYPNQPNQQRLNLIAQSADGAGMIFGKKSQAQFVPFLSQFPRTQTEYARYIPRIAVYNAQGDILYDAQGDIVESKVTGIYSDGEIDNSPASTTSLMPDDIVGVLTQNTNRLYALRLESLLPFVSTTRLEWFDPTDPIHPDPAAKVRYDVEAFLKDPLLPMTDGTIRKFEKISTIAGDGPALDEGDGFGSGYTFIGDLDNDGFTDAAVGAFLDDDGAKNAGAVYILFLKEGGTVKSSQKISGSSYPSLGLGANDFFGAEIVGLGDLNGDGTEDIAVSAPRDDDDVFDGGAIYVLFLGLNTDDGTVDVFTDKTKKIDSSAVNGTLGANSLANLGYLNGDKVLAVGNPDEDAVWILFIDEMGTVKDQTKISASSAGSATGDAFGSAVTALGDINTDDIPHLAVGARLDGATDQGAIYLLTLDTTTAGTVTVQASTKVSSANSTDLNSMLDADDQFGSSIVSMGDLDSNQNTIELAVGAPLDNDGAGNSGAVYLLYMGDPSDSSYDPNYPVASVEKITVSDGAYNDRFGSSVANLGDVDGDGLLELGVGVPFDDDKANGTGSVYNFFFNRN